MGDIGGGTPVIPLPNPGEGGPVGDIGGGTPVIPLPNPGEGGPVITPGGGTPVIPLPNPGEGGPVITPGGGVPVIPLPSPGEGGPVGGAVVIFPCSTKVRFLNAAFGYAPFRIMVNSSRFINVLNYASVSAYGCVPPGYHTVTVTGMDGYIYIQKSMPFQTNASTIAIINTPSGLDLLQINDAFPVTRGNGSFRVSNLALNSGPLDVLLGDGRVVFSDVYYKETTASKRIRPGAYQFFFAETSLMPIPAWQDIETLDAAFLGIYPPISTVGSLYLNVRPNSNYTVFILSSGAARNAVQTMVLEDR